MSTIRYLTQRQAIVDICVQLADTGYLAGTGGNVALRLDEQHFAVTPSAADYYTMTAAQIAVLRLDTLAQVDGELPPSVESALHATLLRARPDRPASVHTHQPVASAVALIGCALPLREAADRAELGPEVAIVPYGPSGTGLLVRALRKRLRPEIHAYLLRNHGLVCNAASLADAARLLGRIERAAAGWLLEQGRTRAPDHPLHAFADAALAPLTAST
ncbi:MAG: class II aldolase/adducin family protein [Paucibacter sp.]|nr:class II aldolase/adducin family protein [Roseateles sp.]